MLVCFTRKESKLMVKRELENLKLIYEIRNQEVRGPHWIHTFDTMETILTL